MTDDLIPVYTIISLRHSINRMLFQSFDEIKLLYPTQRVEEGKIFLTRPSVSPSVLFFVNATSLKSHKEFRETL